MSAELKPCPFCGGNASSGKETATRWSVYCLDCDAEMVGALTEERAIEDWNRRALAAPSQPAARTCDKCRGSGTMTAWVGRGEDVYDVKVDCDQCGGSGAQPAEPVAQAAQQPCRVCGGKGFIDKGLRFPLMKCVSCPRPAAEQAAAEIAGWMTDESEPRYCSPQTKETAMHKGTAAAFDIPLYRRPVRELTDAEIEKLREETFSTNNPFCPVDSESMRKAARAVERALLSKATGEGK